MIKTNNKRLDALEAAQKPVYVSVMSNVYNSEIDPFDRIVERYENAIAAFSVQQLVIDENKRVKIADQYETDAYRQSELYTELAFICGVINPLLDEFGPYLVLLTPKDIDRLLTYPDLLDISDRRDRTRFDLARYQCIAIGQRVPRTHKALRTWLIDLRKSWQDVQQYYYQRRARPRQID